ncbi:MAG: 5-histidylcysteine sulfoxide synthase [Candidatus Melainabacteria bacterium]|nr:MAG: 5-histidylcysteine sulfoxide synthase [Candidatus Melainabacteria bacterium]
MELKRMNPKPELSAVATAVRPIRPCASTLMQSRDWYTGKVPEHGSCPGVDQWGKIHSLPIPNLATCTRQEVQDYFDNSWTLTEVVLSGLASPEVFYRVPYHGLRHPLIFYYLHPAVLYVNKLRLGGLIPGPVNAEFESLFETGVDEMSWDDMSKNTMQWPELYQLHNYRKQVYRLISDLIATRPELDEGHSQVTPEDPMWTLFMGFEHERIHIETSSVLIRELPIECVRKPDAWPEMILGTGSGDASFPPTAGVDFQPSKMLCIEPGDVTVGKRHSEPYYGWDNEYGSRTSSVSAFAVSQNLISNGEFYAFVSSGSYLEPRFWSEQGWKWRSFRNTKFPTFWKLDGPAGLHRYKLRTIYELIPMQWSWPAVVNFYEAEAYCKWRNEREKSESGNEVNFRLLTEAEHYRLRDRAGNVTADMASSKRLNLNLSSGAESPVGMDLNDIDSDRAGDLFGNVWQWCEDHFNPLPGFAVNKYYDDFSVPCFDGEHQMIVGGSFISTGDEATAWARFHFRPHFFQHAGFRIVSSTGDGAVTKLGAEESKVNPYETEAILNEYLTLHFAPAEVQMPFSFISRELTEFPQRCAELVMKWTEKLGITPEKALDVGCAVGGSSFKLAEKFEHVTAVDLSQSFIEAAKKLQSEGSLQYSCRTEGEKLLDLVARVDRSSAEKVEFRRADACALPPEFIDFDAVLMANLLCRLPSPMSCLSRMSGPRGIVRRGGILVLTTPFTWMENFTPKELWFGGQADADKSSEESLMQRMEAEFELLEKFDMPLLIREHQRKYQLISALASVWRRK